VPLVIVDTSARQDIEELIRVHNAGEFVGDVDSQWGQIKDHEGTVALMLTFVRPSEGFAVIEFDIVKQGILVEQILASGGLYVQVGREGDRLKDDLNRQKILVEVPDSGFRSFWNETHEKHLVRHFRTKGLGRGDAKRAAASVLQQLRKFSGFRMPDTFESPT
jgi:hypothetical protein